MNCSRPQRTAYVAASLPSCLFQGQILPLGPLASLLALGLT